MLLESGVAVTAGIVCGIITGLLPGIHINLVAAVLLSSAFYLQDVFGGLSLAAFIIAMAVTHTFLDIIPTIFLGAPNPETALAVLPGHAFLLKGLGFEAVRITTTGSLLSMVFSIITMPLLVYIVPSLYKAIKPSIGYLLVGVAVLIILKEHTVQQKFIAALLFIFSGILGCLTLNLYDIRQPLLPLLSGLFGMSTLLISLNERVVLPQQRIDEFIKLKRYKLLKTTLASTFAGWIASLLPAIGSAQATILARFFFQRMSKLDYLLIVGGVNTTNLSLSLITFYTLAKARNGAVVAVQNLVGGIGLAELVFFVCIVLLVSGIATILTLNLSRIIADVIPRIDYKKVCLAVICFLFLLVVALSGLSGLLIFLVATSIGLLANLYHIKRCILMGCLMLPVIVVLFS